MRMLRGVIGSLSFKLEDSLEESGTKVSLSYLKMLTIIIPAAFLLLLFSLLHGVLSVLHNFPGSLIIFVLLIFGIALFSLGVFRIFNILGRQVLEQNKRLSIMNEIAVTSAKNLELKELLGVALERVLEVMHVEAGVIYLNDYEKDELTSVRYRGFSEALVQLMRDKVITVGTKDNESDESELEKATEDLFRDPRVSEEARAEGFNHGVGVTLAANDEISVFLGIATERKNEFTQGELKLLASIRGQLAIALENSRLHERVLDAAVIEERERIARELHDGMAQVLGYINTQTLAVRKLLESGQAEEAEHQVRAMEKEAKRVYTDVREEILGLRTSLDSRDGLIASVRMYLREYGQMADATLDMDVSKKAEAIALPASTEIQLMRIIQEAISNIRKHARADRATVSFDAECDVLTIKVEDDGQGYVHEPVHTGWPRFGLRTMRERAEAIGGEFDVVSALGSGTTVIVRLPIENNLKSSEIEVPCESPISR